MEPRRTQGTNLLFIVAGAAGIVVAILRLRNDIQDLTNDIQYVPSDIRSHPWFDPAVSAFMAAWSVLFLAVGVIRFIQTARSRNE
jgi:hypothetical protein